MADDAPPTRRTLDSWKEIGAFLGRDARTAQRWERHEGLPVHRQPHHARNSVLAYPEELKAWRRDRGRSAKSSVAFETRPGDHRRRGRNSPAGRAHRGRRAAHSSRCGRGGARFIWSGRGQRGTARHAGIGDHFSGWADVVLERLGRECDLPRPRRRRCPAGAGLTREQRIPRSRTCAIHCGLTGRPGGLRCGMEFRHGLQRIDLDRRPDAAGRRPAARSSARGGRVPGWLVCVLGSSMSSRWRAVG